jgi:hypothetical protein
MRHPIAARLLARPRATFYAFDLFVNRQLPEVGHRSMAVCNKLSYAVKHSFWLR